MGKLVIIKVILIFLRSPKMKNLFYAIIILFAACSTGFTESYNVTEYSITADTQEKIVYSFYDNSTFYKGSQSGEYIMFAAYTQEEDGGSVLLYYKDNFSIFGYGISVLETGYNLFIFEGIVNE